jgi:hypothetical protein
VRWGRERDRRHEFRCSVRLGLHASSASRRTNRILFRAAASRLPYSPSPPNMAGNAIAKP